VDSRVRDYLIRAHNRVIAHYHQVLEANSLAQLERDRIQRGLATVEAELETIVTGGASASRRLVQAHELSPEIVPG
jgi:hypothetical protein